MQGKVKVKDEPHCESEKQNEKLYFAPCAN